MFAKLWFAYNKAKQGESHELQKRRPKWDKIKKVIIWALDYGKDFFVQLLPLFLKTGSNI